MNKLQILGTGCPKCKKLAENAEIAAKESGIDYEIEKVTDINDIMNFSVMMTPAFAIDGEPVWISDTFVSLDLPFRVVITGKSAGTQILVGDVQVWTGVRDDVNWAAWEGER